MSNTKQVKTQLWVNDTGTDRGQKSRPCLVDYTVNSIGSKSLYHVIKIIDARTQTEYDVEKTLQLNGDMDEAIARSDPKQVAYAKKELGVDLKNGGKKMKAPVPRPKIDDDDDMPLL